MKNCKLQESKYVDVVGKTSKNEPPPQARHGTAVCVCVCVHECATWAYLINFVRRPSTKW